jgi:hypothetical protein
MALAMPFCRDNRYRQILENLRMASSDQAAVQEAIETAERHIRGQMERWRPKDYRDAMVGIVLITLSYFCGAAHEIQLLNTHSPEYAPSNTARH